MPQQPFQKRTDLDEDTHPLTGYSGREPLPGEPRGTAVKVQLGFYEQLQSNLQQLRESDDMAIITALAKIQVAQTLGLDTTSKQVRESLLTQQEFNLSVDFERDQTGALERLTERDITGRFAAITGTEYSAAKPEALNLINEARAQARAAALTSAAAKNLISETQAKDALHAVTHPEAAPTTAQSATPVPHAGAPAKIQARGIINDDDDGGHTPLEAAQNAWRLKAEQELFRRGHPADGTREGGHAWGTEYLTKAVGKVWLAENPYPQGPSSERS